MQPATTDTASGHWVLYNEKAGYVIYNMNSNEISIDLSTVKGSYQVVWIDVVDGATQKKGKTVKGGKTIILEKPKKNSCVLWLKPVGY